MTAARRVLLTIFGLSLAVVLLEIVLARLFAGLVYDELIYVPLALAMLGLAAGGALEVVARQDQELEALLREQTGRAMVGSIVFAVAVVAINLGPAAWLDARLMDAAATDGAVAAERLFMLGRAPLALLYGAASVPLFLSLGRAVAAILRACADRVSTLYAADLVGAALGAGLAVVALSLLTGVGYVLLPAVLVIAVAALWSRPRRLALLPALALLLTTQVLDFPRLDAHSLRALRRPDQVRLASAWSEFAYMQLIEDPRGRWRVLQDHHSSVEGFTYDPAERACHARGEGCPLDPWLGLADALRPAPRSAAVLAAGVGYQVRDGLRFGLDRIVAVELNADLLPFAISQRPRAGLQELVAEPGVDYLVDDVRHFARTTDEHFDIVLVPPNGRPKSSNGPGAADHTLTEEAIADYLACLNPSGLLAVTLGLPWHPDYLAARARVLGLLRRGLARAGVDQPEQHFAFFTPNYVYLSPTPFTAAERQRASALARSLGGRAVTLTQLEATVTPDPRRVTDDSPFWNHATTWPATWEASADLGSARRGRPGVGAVLALTHLLALLGVLLVLVLPLARRREARLALVPGDGLFLATFSFLGLGFMAFEIPLVEQAVFVAGHPVRSLAFCLAGLLLSTGLGSALAGRYVLAPDGPRWPRLRAVFLVLTALQLVLWAGLQPALELLSHAPSWLLLPALMVGILPAGLALGVPFPMATALLHARGRGALIPWAWAANGALSVLGVHVCLTATRIVGMSPMFGVAAGCYAAAGLSLAAARRPQARSAFLWRAALATGVLALLVAGVVGALSGPPAQPGPSHPSADRLEREARLADLRLFSEPLGGGDLLLPPATKMAEVRAFVERLFVPTTAFPTAYHDLEVFGARAVALPSGDPALAVDYHLAGRRYTAWALGARSADAPHVIPGGGRDQATPIAHDDPTSDHRGVIQAARAWGDTFVLVRPGEDVLAIHDGEHMLAPAAIHNHLVGRGGSYATTLVIDSLAVTKALQGSYAQVAVLGLSRGGEAAMANLLQSAPDKAVVASGYTVASARDRFGVPGPPPVPGLDLALDLETLPSRLAAEPTELLLTWDRGDTRSPPMEREAARGYTCQLLADLPNVTCQPEDGGDALLATLVRHHLGVEAGVEASP